ncbi:YheC/YheD family protein [Thalassobacillus hwangdonensis]|uniref:YheC/YheD family protein n=1 Tax=Thalassobacillus hwangdonensis TaxID=546108 RepID=A0ABW3L560_9BACI
MLVGFMRLFKKPPHIAKLTAMMCSYYGMELIYLRPRDVDIENHKVKGKIYRNGKWVTEEREIPPLVDIYAYCYRTKYKEIADYLKKNTLVTYDRKNILSKDKLQDKLVEDEAFAHLVIPTMKAGAYDDVKQFLKDHGQIVLKPVHGERGKGVYILHQDEGEYVLGYQKEETRLSEEELNAFFEEKIENKNYILQKYISSRSVHGDPFDCRIHIQKNRNGKWQIAKKYIRIGIGQKVMSNVNQGGGISDTEPFLKANFGDDWEEIEQKLNELGTTLPYKIEQLKKTPTMSLGLDVAIDRDGSLYLFEANNAPATTSLLGESAMLNVEYYRYLQRKVLNWKAPVKEQLEEKAAEATDDLHQEKATLETELKQLQETNRQLQKRQKQMEQSTSWRLTAPIRKIGTLLKK